MRRAVQWLSALALNPLLPFFFLGRIHQGWSKRICVPALNCYSCPGAWGACPIGSAQVMMSSVRGYMAGTAEAAAAWATAYVLGFVALIGALVGRLACGWVCPFGLAQDLLYRRGRRGRALPPWTRFLKYGVLAVFIVILPLAFAYPSSPLFCKWICPAGTFEAGLPLVAYDRISGSAIYGLGLLFAWKVGLLGAFIAAAVFFSRSFCRTICPLGASWALFNRVSLLAVKVDAGRCTSCGVCQAACPADVAVYREADSGECIRCLHCAKACPQGAVSFGVRGVPRRAGRPAELPAAEGAPS